MIPGANRDCAGAERIVRDEMTDDGDAMAGPVRFEEALDAIRNAIARCEVAEIPVDTILAALMTEVMPRMVDAYGSYRVISVLNDLAAHIAADASECPSGTGMSHSRRLG